MVMATSLFWLVNISLVSLLESMTLWHLGLLTAPYDLNAAPISSAADISARSAPVITASSKGRLASASCHGLGWSSSSYMGMKVLWN
ncbi:hypothetical protein F5Y05DRAFT_387133 [Hypoxylon sp. FL0543]|nr:hypothetical protein F5Y05DRAFT_387133 [Hypoxylon sp. FL0543]